MVEIKTLLELKNESDETRKKLSEFYDRLPSITDPKMIITECQEHISSLIDHIIDCHEFIDAHIAKEKLKW